MKKISYILSLLIIASMVLAACTPAATEAPEVATEAATEAAPEAATEAAMASPADMEGTLRVWAFAGDSRAVVTAF